jgi:hypothetical protein
MRHIPEDLYCIFTGEVHLRIDHEGPEGEYNYSSTLSLTSALDGVGGLRHASAASPRERPRTDGTGDWVGPRAGLDGCEKSRPPPHGIRFPHRPARS